MNPLETGFTVCTDFISQYPHTVENRQKYLRFLSKVFKETVTRYVSQFVKRLSAQLSDFRMTYHETGLFTVTALRLIWKKVPWTSPHNRVEVQYLGVLCGSKLFYQLESIWPALCIVLKSCFYYISHEDTKSQRIHKLIRNSAPQKTRRTQRKQSKI